MTRRRSFGNVRQRASGRWQARWQDNDGTWHNATATFRTKAEGTAWLAAEETDRQRGAWTDPRHGKMVFEAWARQWQATTVNLRASTTARDANYLNAYILPTFGRRRLEQIDHMAVRAWIASLTARGLAPATVGKAGQIMAKIMRTAVDARMLPVNPCDEVRFPTVERDEMRFLSSDDLAALADAIDPRYRPLVLLGGYGALRPGELFGLKVRRVDPLHRHVTVAEIVTEASGHLNIGPPKTRASRRVVPIPAFVADELAAHAAGKHPDDLMFPAPEGNTYVRGSNWRPRIWVPALRLAGIEPCRVHDLRHTAISFWISEGADPVSIARWAGHRSTITVMDVYGHPSAAGVDRTMSKLDTQGTAAAARSH